MDVFYTEQEKVDTYGITRSLLFSMYDEIQALSKKKHDAVLNKTKIKTINRLLKDILGYLGEEPEAKYLDLVDEDTVPQYSDVVILLSQYKSAVTAFQARYFRYNPFFDKKMWNTEDAKREMEEYQAELEAEDDEF